MNLLESARKHNIKQFVFGSSSSVYGINAKVPFSEDDPIRQPISPYAAPKAAASVVVIPIRIVRYSAAFASLLHRVGPRQRPDLAIHKFARLLTEANRFRFLGW